MATIALTAVGGALGGPVGAFVGAMLGSYIDQQYVFPAIFGTDDMEGPRLRDFKIQTASEGSPLQRCFGPHNRVSGTLIWLSADSPIEFSNESGGGKGGGGAAQTNFVYKANLAIAVCEGQISSIKKIWADNNLLFDTPDPVSLSSSNWEKVGKYVPGDGTGKVMKLWFDTAVGVGSPDAADAGYVTGQDCTVSGFTGLRTGNNGTYKLKKIVIESTVSEVQTISATGGTSGFFRLGYDGDSTGAIQWNATAADVKDALVGMVHGTIFEDIDITAAGGPINALPVTITFDGGELDGDDIDAMTVAEDQIVGAAPSVVETTKGSKRGHMNFKFPIGQDVVTENPSTDTIQVDQTPEGSSVGKVKSITRYLGAGSQTANTLIQSYEGDTNVPAYRGTAYVVFEELKLSDYGNHIPNFTFEVEEAATRTVGEAISFIVQESGLPASGVDVTAITDILDGYAIAGAQRTVRKLEPLMLAFDITATEHNGTITFSKRGGEDSVTIDENDLGAHAHGGRVVSKIQQSQSVPDINLPKEVQVEFIEYETDMQKSTQRMSRINAPSPIVKKVGLPITMLPSEARDIAARLLWEEWSSRRKIRFTLPPSYHTLQNGDVMIVTDGTETLKVRLTRLHRGFNFLHKCEGFIESRPLLAWNSPADGYNGGGDNGGLYVPPDTDGWVLDIAAIRSGDEQELGIYVAANATDRSALWQGCDVQRAGTGNSNYGSVQVLPIEADGGQCLTALANDVVTGWDYGGTLDVYMAHGSLSSATLEEVTSGEKNWFVVGEQGRWEIIAAMDVEVIGTNTYRLSRLLRGLRNTWEHTSTHSIDDTFMVLASGTVEFSAMGLSNIGNGYDFKFVPDEGDVADWDVTTTLDPFTGATRKCFPPVRLSFSEDGFINLTITWERQTRALIDQFGAQGTPLIPTSESYEIDIEDPNNPGQVIRTLTATTTTVEYTALNKLADGYSLNDAVNFLGAWQLDNQIGRGYSTGPFSSVTTPSGFDSGFSSGFS